MIKKLPIWDQRMFKLMQIKMMSVGIKSIANGFLYENRDNQCPTISQVRNGKQSFRLKHSRKPVIY